MSYYPFAATFATIALLSFSMAYMQYRRSMRLGLTPISKIRSAAMGQVHIEGKTEAAEIMYSPLFIEPCLFCEYSISRYSILKHKPLYAGTQGRFMYVRDKTGTVLVDLQDCKLIANAKHRTFELALLPAGTHELIRDKTQLGEHASLYLEEKTIENNTKVFIQGKATDNPFIEDATQLHGYKDVMVSDTTIHLKHKYPSMQLLRNGSTKLTNVGIGALMIASGFFVLEMLLRVII